MRTEVTDIPRRTWAPFVGAALAALTAGSLVVFSLIAQKTSLDGFPDRRVTATGAAEDPSPSSITIAPVESAEGTDGRVVADRSASSAPSATALLEIAQTPSPTVAVASVDGVSSEATAADSDPGADEVTAITTAAPTGSFRAEEPLLTRHAGGGGYEGDGTAAAAEWDARHNGKHTHRSHDAKERGRQDKVKKTSKRSKGSSKAKDAARSGRRDRHRRGHGNNRGAAQHASHGSPPRSAPPRSSRPAPTSSNAAPKSKSSSGSPPAHSNAGGNGKSRGRGHGKR